MLFRSIFLNQFEGNIATPSSKTKARPKPRPNSQTCVIYSPAFVAALAIIMGLLRTANERGIIAAADFEAVARALLGGVLTYAIQGLLMAKGEAPPPERADALVELLLRGLEL